MKTKTLFRSFLLLCSFFCCSAAAQIAPKIESYKAGESLLYEAKFSKTVLRGIEVAALSFTVESAPESRNFVVKTEAKPKGTLSGVFLPDFLQNYESTVDGRNFSILKTVKRDKQGDRVRDSAAIFDYKTRKVVYIETDPNNVARPPLNAASPVESGMQDLVSALYTLRRLPLGVGKSFELKVSDSGLVYTIPLRVIARVRQKSIFGNVWCFQVEAEIFGKNRLIEKEGNMILWITDDARRIPVRSQINSSLGRIEVKLKQATTGK